MMVYNLNIAVILELLLLAVPTECFSQFRRGFPRSVLIRNSLLSDDVLENNLAEGKLGKTGFDFQAWGRGFSNCPKETGPVILSCVLPSDFPVGTYFRNGHARFVADDGTPVIHPFDGDGMISAITFDPANNRILFRNKYVETEAYLKDKLTGTMSQRGLFGTMKSGGLFANMFRMDYKNVGNTNVIYAGGTLYALWEGGRPHALDPLTLRNKNDSCETDLEGLLAERFKENFSAHPRYDPKTKSWFNFGNNFDPLSGKTRIRLFMMDKTSFRPKQTETSLLLDDICLTHDFLLTENYCIFNINKSTMNNFVALKSVLGLSGFANSVEMIPDEKEASIVLFPRSLFDDETESSVDVDILNDDRVKILRVPNFSNFHFGNSFEEKDDKVYFDTVQWSTNNLLIETKGPLWENENIFDKVEPTNLVRYCLDVEKGSICEENSPKTITSQAPEFPTVPRELSTKSYRYVYPVAAHKDFDSSGLGSGPAGAIMKCDTQDPTLNEIFSFEPYEFPGEAAFVPKVGKDITQASDEDAAYLISYVVNGKDETTDLVIFDVEGKGSLEKGPILRMKLPTFLPHGLHGNFEEGVTFDFKDFE